MRVIAGSARGRTLTAPRGLAIRPTTDKVKGAMFSMLEAEAFKRAEEDEHSGNETEEAGGSEGDAPDEDDAGFPFRRVLDLFAGTGALGIEALSRGSDRCDFVESNARARAAIEENLRRTGLTRQAAIHTFRVEQATSTFRAPYDLILADPPYADPTLPVLLATIGASGIIHERTLVMIEHARTVELPATPGRLRQLRSRYHGTTAITLYASGVSDVGKPPSLR